MAATRPIIKAESVDSQLIKYEIFGKTAFEIIKQGIFAQDILIMNIFIISVITLLNMYDSKKEIALMRLIGIGMNKINLVYIIQNGIIGLISTVLAFAASRLCLVLMGEYVASMGIVLDSARIYPLELAIMALIFVISVIPTVICTLNMSRKDGLSE